MYVTTEKGRKTVRKEWGREIKITRGEREELAYGKQEKKSCFLYI